MAAKVAIQPYAGFQLGAAHSFLRLCAPPADTELKDNNLEGETFRWSEFVFVVLA
ncbi:MAG: hypothetical protein WCE68_14505 [Anaerolineales bacterium]